MSKFFWFVLALGSTIFVTVASLWPGSSEKNIISDIDKIYHAVAYGVIFLFWAHYLMHKWQLTRLTRKQIAAVSIAVLGYSILIEPAQKYLAENRTCDVNDVFANAFGIVIGILILTFKSRIFLKSR